MKRSEGNEEEEDEEVEIRECGGRQKEEEESVEVAGTEGRALRGEGLEEGGAGRLHQEHIPAREVLHATFRLYCDLCAR